MKKTFPLRRPGVADQRVVETIKRDVRRYVKRERAKTPPAEFDVWEFHCKGGPTAANAESRALKEITGAIDAVAATGAEAVFIELAAVPAAHPR